MRRLAFAVIIIAVTSAGFFTPASAKSGSLSEVTVQGNAGEKPTVKLGSKPFSVSKSKHRIITPGTGAVLTAGTKTTINYVLVNGRTGKELDSTFETTPAALLLDKKQAPPGIVNAVVGEPLGSRIAVAIPPKAGYTKSLIDAGVTGVKKNDTLLFVLDVTSVRTPLPRAAGESVTAPAGLPTVELGGNGKPTITVPKETAPTTLIAQPLIKGTGATVTAGQTITAHYSGVIWASGELFDSSWDRNETVDFVIGVGQVIPGWDQALVGQTVGSQLLLVIPPDQGYGTTGNSNAGISGTDTLVFVVDILDVY